MKEGIVLTRKWLKAVLFLDQALIHLGLSFPICEIGGDVMVFKVLPIVTFYAPIFIIGNLDLL